MIDKIENLKFKVDPVELARIDEECGPLGFDEYIQEDVVMEIMKAIGNFDIEVEISDVDEETGEITYNLYQ